MFLLFLVSQEYTKRACGITVAPIIPTVINNALEFAIIGTIEWYSMAEGSGFVIKTSYKYPKLILKRIE
jgi:hypothetical protein